MSKALQTFSDEYLARCQELNPESIVKFLEDFRSIHGQQKVASKLISMKVPEDLLGAFKRRCQMLGTPYQTQIKRLMSAWMQQQETD